MRGERARGAPAGAHGVGIAPHFNGHTRAVRCLGAVPLTPNYWGGGQWAPNGVWGPGREASRVAAFDGRLLLARPVHPRRPMDWGR